MSVTMPDIERLCKKRILRNIKKLQTGKPCGKECSWDGTAFIYCPKTVILNYSNQFRCCFYTSEKFGLQLNYF
ncbi:hypothetical protein [uncultured Subdoligranulum sp.]|uniref:hypothetical protein n=1 Tax=uncultured Subdoligranulum sp. TaxID=512298 RepID=UPI0026362687|nr:hypothetical protein [uncultured Subdoligranulum sp.]